MIDALKLAQDTAVDVMRVEKESLNRDKELTALVKTLHEIVQEQSNSIKLLMLTTQNHCIAIEKLVHEKHS